MEARGEEEIWRSERPCRIKVTYSLRIILSRDRMYSDICRALITTDLLGYLIAER